MSRSTRTLPGRIWIRNLLIISFCVLDLCISRSLAAWAPDCRACVRVFVCACVRMRECVCVCVRVFVCACVRMRECLCACVQVFVCAGVRMRECLCVCGCVFVCAGVRMRVSAWSRVLGLSLFTFLLKSYEQEHQNAPGSDLDQRPSNY